MQLLRNCGSRGGAGFSLTPGDLRVTLQLLRNCGSGLARARL